MRLTTGSAAAIAFFALAACSSKSTDILDSGAATAPAVLNLAPPNAATGVDPSRPIVITFNRPMMLRMEALVLLHEGSVTGPVVAGVASWSATQTTLTFVPATPLKARTTYVLHLAPNVRAANGLRLNLASCARLGGQTVTPGMIGAGSRGGMMNSGWGPGMMSDDWRAADGTFGMIFTFTTA